MHMNVPDEEVSALEQQLGAETGRAAACIATACDGALPAAWARGLAPAVLARSQALATSTLNYITQQLDNINDNLLVRLSYPALVV